MNFDPFFIKVDTKIVVSPAVSAIDGYLYMCYTWPVARVFQSVITGTKNRHGKRIFYLD